MDNLTKLTKYLDPTDVEVVVYHSPCSDGFGAAYVFWRMMNLNNKFIKKQQKIDFVPLAHSNDEQAIRSYLLPRIQGKNVVFVDICPKENHMQEMIEIAPKKCIVLVHHKGMLNVFEKFPLLTSKHIYYDINHSGVILAWQYCYGSQPSPRFMDLIEDRDIWTEKYPETNAFCAVFHKIPFDFELYAQYENEEILQQALIDGATVLKYQDIEINTAIIPHAVERSISIDGVDYRVMVLNTQVYVSEIGNILSKKSDFAILWHYNHKKGILKISLRSDKHSTNFVDVATIAKKFKGGGHPSAASFSVEYPDFIGKVMSKEQVSKLNMCLPFLKAFGLVASGVAIGVAAGVTYNKNKTLI